MPQISNEELKDFCQYLPCSSNYGYPNGALYKQQYDKTMKERRDSLESMLSPSINRKNDTVILMTVNYGFSWLFSNWVCSLEHNLNENEIQNIKSKTIVVVTDEKSEKLVNSMGFMTHFPVWLGPNILSNIEEDASDFFGERSHTEINMLTIMLMNDLMQLNYNVLVQDVDIVWNKNPINYLLHNVVADISMSFDGRGDKRGPGNSGFIFLKNNCVTKVFAKTLCNARSQIYYDGSDQMMWNRLINDTFFRQLHFETLDEKLFANGHVINLVHGGALHSDHFVFHASWVHDSFDKIEKFMNTKHFYYLPELCSYHDENMILDISKRIPKKEDIESGRIQKQEDKFVKLGLFKNETKTGTKRKIYQW